MNHEARRAKGRTYNDCKSLTDQSQADDTNINVILRKYGVTGVAQGVAGHPQYLDHSELPKDLREAFDMARKATSLRATLPEGLRDKPIEQLSKLTMDELNAILHPPAKPPATPQDDKK